MRGIFLTSAVTATLLLTGQAQAAASMAADSSVSTVTVTGVRDHNQTVPMKASFTESVIGIDTIQNSSTGPGSTIQTLLNSQPSILADQGGANGMNTKVTFRSFSDGEFGETVERVPMNDIFNGGVMSQADNRNNVLFIKRDIEGVKVYRGINNPDVNTYNSLGGTVNYMLRKPSDDYAAQIGAGAGSFGTINFHAQIDTGDFHGVRQTLSYQHDYSNGWFRNTPDTNDNIYYAATADLNANTQIYAYAVYNRNVGSSPEAVPVNLIRQNGYDYQYPRSTHYQNNADSNAMGIAGIKSRINDIFTVEDKIYIGNNDYKRTAYTNPPAGFMYYLPNHQHGYAWWTASASYTGIPEFGSTTAGTSYQFYGYHGALYGDNLRVMADLPHNTVIAGGDFNVGELHSREYWYGAYDMPKITGYNDAWNEHDTRQMWSAYIQDDIHFWNNRVHITPGVKYIQAITKDNDAAGIYYDPAGSLKAHNHVLSPTFGASVEPVKNLTIYASYGKNIKFPDITSLYNELGWGGTVPPATVKAEHVSDYEAGLRYKWHALQAVLNAYQEDFSDIIYSITLPSGASFQKNGGNERYRGLELQLNDNFGDIGFGNLSGYFNASYNEAVCATSFGQAVVAGASGGCTKGVSLPDVPTYLLSTGLTWDYQGWRATVDGRFVGKKQLKDYYTGLPADITALNAAQPTHSPSYVLVDLGVSKVFPLHDAGAASSLRVALHADNIFNTHYYADANENGGYVYARMGMPRAVFANMSVNF
jgi:hypothetical protein